ncbi:MAG TPA: CBS domain-containing protein [Vicinamibacterales bacterium]|jgi:CBS domain-containing protein|nr:CBS domain-containing protein [Vicinamibacterales bacterium]
MRLEDVMSRQVQTIGAQESLERARALMRLRRIHHLVVVEGRSVIGVVTDDVLQRGEAEGIGRVEDVMFRNVVTGTPDLTVREAANLMRGRAIGAVPILDKRRLVGIVTVSDLLDLLGKGAERPVARSQRWTLRDRGTKPRRAQPSR